jgi:hypothetical protein
MFRILALGALVVGLALAAFAIFADAIIGGEPGFGWGQWVVLLLGLWLALIAALALRGWRVLFIRAMFASAAILVALAVTEIGLRIYGYLHPQYTWMESVQPSACCYYENTPGLVARGVLGETVAINQVGARDDHEYTAERRPGATRIAVVGDSMTFGMGLELHETYVKGAAARLGKVAQVEFLNFGLPGSSTRIQAEHVRHHVLAFAPDIVVAQVFPDDFGDISPDFLSKIEQERQRRATRGSFQHVVFGLRGPELAAVVSVARDRWARRGDRKAPWIEDVERRLAHFQASAPWYLNYMRGDVPAYQRASVEKDFLAMVAAARQQSIRTVMLFIPDVVQLGRPELQRVNAVFREIAEHAGIPFLDVTPEFERDPRGSRGLYLLPRDAHPSAAGAEVIGDVLARHLAGMLDRTQ